MSEVLEATVEDLKTETCPGHFQWSAFGAPYMDTVCASVLDWSKTEDGYPGNYLCDADNDFSAFAGIPCPMHDWVNFYNYLFGGGYVVPLCPVGEHEIPETTQIDFHDAKALFWSAECPEHGRQRLLMRDMSDQEGFDDEHFVPWEPKVETEPLPPVSVITVDTKAQLTAVLSNLGRAGCAQVALRVMSTQPVTFFARNEDVENSPESWLIHPLLFNSAPSKTVETFEVESAVEVTYLQSFDETVLEALQGVN